MHLIIIPTIITINTIMVIIAIMKMMMFSEADQGAYSCEAINSQGSCFAGSAGCGQPGQV